MRARPIPAGIVVLFWTLVIVMVVPEGFDYSLLGMPSPTEGSAFSRLIWLALLAGGAAVVLRHAALARQVLRQLNPFLVAFVVLAFASVCWSIEPAFTLRRMIRVGTILVDALAVVLVCWHPDQLQRLLRPILTLILVGSITLVLAFPELGIERSASFELAGAWHGLATQKNGLGSIAAIGTLLWLHAWLCRRVTASAPLPAIALGLTASIVCLLGSRSSTSLMATVFAAPFMVFLMHSPAALRRYMPYLIGSFAFALLLYSLAVLQLVPGLELLLKPIVMFTGKDQTFSGRTAIWGVVSEHIRQYPLFGSGYGAYWIGPMLGSPSADVMTRLYFYPTEAHNGYLDIINDLGAAGGLLLLGFLVWYLRQSLRLYALERAQGALYLALFFEQLIANLSESRWLNVLCLEFVIMTLVCTALARGLLQYRRFRPHDIQSATARRATPAR